MSKYFSNKKRLKLNIIYQVKNMVRISVLLNCINYANSFKSGILRVTDYVAYCQLILYTVISKRSANLCNIMHIFRYNSSILSTECILRCSLLHIYNLYHSFEYFSRQLIHFNIYSSEWQKRILTLWWREVCQ